MITEEYKKLNQQLHEENEAYGTSGDKYADFVKFTAVRFGINEIIDYGCGKMTLANALPQFKFFNYDPCIPGHDVLPEPKDLVVSTDVAEHIEPEHLDHYLDELRRLGKKYCIMVVSNVPSKKTLSDGRNTHLIVQPYDWWLPKLWSRWRLEMFSNYGGSAFQVLLAVPDA